MCIMKMFSRWIKELKKTKWQAMLHWEIYSHSDVLVFGTWVADGKHQTSMWSALTLKCLWETMAPRFVSCHRRTWCQESSPEVMASFMSASVANELTGASEWLQGGEKSLDHILQTECVTGHGTSARRLRTVILTVQILNPVMSISLEPLRSTLLLSDLQQTMTWSRLSPPGSRCLILIFVEQTLKCQFWLHGDLTYTIYCYQCATYTTRCEYSCWH
jgi:hypothetical protein